MHGGWKGVTILAVAGGLYMTGSAISPQYGWALEIAGAICGLIGCGYMMNYARDRID